MAKTTKKSKPKPKPKPRKKKKIHKLPKGSQQIGFG
jgi:hypothetical protein